MQRIRRIAGGPKVYLNPDSFHIAGLGPYKVWQYWDVIVASIKKGNPEAAGDKVTMVNIMGAIMSGGAQTWAFFSKKEGRLTFLGCAVTTIQENQFTRYKSLSVLSLYSAHPLGLPCLRKMVMQGKEFADENGCVSVTGIIADERIARLAKKLGFKSAILATSEVM